MRRRRLRVSSLCQHRRIILASINRHVRRNAVWHVATPVPFHLPRLFLKGLPFQCASSPWGQPQCCSQPRLSLRIRPFNRRSRSSRPARARPPSGSPLTFPALGLAGAGLGSGTGSGTGSSTLVEQLELRPLGAGFFRLAASLDNLVANLGGQGSSDVVEAIYDATTQMVTLGNTAAAFNTPQNQFSLSISEDGLVGACDSARFPICVDSLGAPHHRSELPGAHRYHRDAELPASLEALHGRHAAQVRVVRGPNRDLHGRQHLSGDLNP